MSQMISGASGSRNHSASRRRPSRHSQNKEPCRCYQTGFFHHDQHRAGESGGRNAILQKQHEREHKENHGRHIQLRHHRLREEQRGGREEPSRQNRRVPRQAHADCQPERDYRAHGRERQHRKARGGDGIAGDRPHGRQVRHHARRMHIGNGRMGNPGAALKHVERRRNKLAQLVPIKRQLQKSGMTEEYE